MPMGYRQYEQPTHKVKAVMKRAAARNRLRRERAARKAGRPLPPVDG